MEPHLSLWLNLVVRWIHVTVGIAWIGTSFYFNWLNDRLRPPDRPIDGVAGELWSVHGGGFYRVTKFEGTPGEHPSRLHWFKWEAYSTWLSGLVLLVLVYYLNADFYLLGPTESHLSKETGIALSLGALVAGWLGYQALCRSPLVNHPAVLGLIGVALVMGVAYGLNQFLTGRATYLHIGAMLGTIMAANVFFVIIPSQKAALKAMVSGREPDTSRLRDAALRSRHNNYLTLPVLFIMVSNHFPMTFAHRYNWAILATLFIVGVAARWFFNRANQERRVWWVLPAAVLAILALALVTR